VILGILEMVVFNSFYDKFDGWLLTSAAAPYYILVALAALLFMCPQPRPRTPTFMQTCQCVGLAIGACFGHRAWAGFVRNEAAAGPSAPLFPVLASLHPALQIVLRLVVGYAVVIAIDVLAKFAMVMFAKLAMGVDIRVPFVGPSRDASAVPSREGSRETAKPKKRNGWQPHSGEDPIDRAFAHPDDSKAFAVRIGAEATVKVGKYALVAVGISSVAPIILETLGLGCAR